MNFLTYGSVCRGIIAHYPAREAKTDKELSRPFLKWPGGKFEVFRTIEQYLPSSGRLIEPFAGAGSIFINAGYSTNIVADLNSDLINTYLALKEQAHSLITLTRRFFDDYLTKEGYLTVKEKFNRMHYTRIERAAAFIYLNKHCFHGLVRYNLKGEFNVGWGSPKKAYFPLTEIEHFLSVADRCEFHCNSFEETISLAGTDDVIFCDPPYEPLPVANGFTKYAGETFSFDQQERLVESLTAAVSRGAHAIITNSGAPKIRELYTENGFTIYQLKSRRSISCKSKGREWVNDVIAEFKTIQ
ncbi:DNA adenine methylase [Enterobacter kobei]|uniref:DNA adenine methylase n=1 Tax=Enterobacter kobei TaxID=208224 RepID=UPI0021C0947C|nr:Dam family site-specific DNA-(adenine-N6)-methyltransferase [Enterobacter kobei]UXJ66774.1 Dam family site-specific DNA-(adenine-N6)-methyltransferase [Enterobacter kobei]HCR0386804.1 Dam family site-specific DNA-(adenine-N6)-methyltransferase [Enterobacter kobei]